MITLQNLKDIKPGTIFAEGIVLDNSEGINAAGSGKKLRWVAVRGGIWDWAIYYYWSDKSSDEVARNGDKVYDESIIKKFVSCDDEAFAMYRY